MTHCGNKISTDWHNWIIAAHFDKMCDAWALFMKIMYDAQLASLSRLKRNYYRGTQTQFPIRLDQNQLKATTAEWSCKMRPSCTPRITPTLSRRRSPAWPPLLPTCPICCPYKPMIYYSNQDNTTITMTSWTYTPRPLTRFSWVPIWEYIKPILCWRDCNLSERRRLCDFAMTVAV